MPKVKHIALIKFKEGTSQEQVDQVFNELLDVTENVPGIEDYVSGPNTSPEGLTQGYSHGVVMTFKDSAARDTYLGHPDHERFKTIAMPLVDSVVALDFEV